MPAIQTIRHGYRTTNKIERSWFSTPNISLAGGISLAELDPGGTRAAGQPGRHGVAGYCRTGESGIEACRKITSQWPDVKMIMLTSSVDDELIFKALQAGASGYVLKQVGNQALISALEAARRGESLLDPIATKRVIQHVRETEKQRQAHAFHDLSLREMEVLVLVADGKSNSEIAGLLSLSEKTVGHHVSAILS